MGWEGSRRIEPASVQVCMAPRKVGIDTFIKISQMHCTFFCPLKESSMPTLCGQDIDQN